MYAEFLFESGQDLFDTSFESLQVLRRNGEVDPGYPITVCGIEGPFAEVLLQGRAVPVSVVVKENQRFGQVAVVESFGTDNAADHLLWIGS